MPRYRATLAYDGAAYQGFQRQAAGIPTVQGAVEAALTQIAGQFIGITGAGRTDSGVHATGQVIAFDLDWSHDDATLVKAINANLPQDIAVQDACQHEGFHPRFDALARGYRYQVMVTQVRQPLLANRTWQIRDLPHFAEMQAAAQMLIGEHDFAAFGTPPQGDNTVRLIYRSEWALAEQGQQLTYRVEATAFLYQMVRRIVGMTVAVGRGSISLNQFEQVFKSADLSQAKHLAPPQGLVLELVRYPDGK